MTATVIQLAIRTKAAKKSKPRSNQKSLDLPLSRIELLGLLRAESKRRTGEQYSMQEDSLLVDLANAAAYRRGRHFTWRGIRFPLRHSLWLVVLDPYTGEPLVSTKGGII